MYPIANATQITDLFIYANTVTSGWFWQLILLALYIVTYISLSYTTQTMKAFTVTTTFCGIIGTFMYALAWIPESTWIICMVLAVASFVMLLFQQGQYE